MKRQSIVILAVVATLLLGGIAMAQSNGGNIYTGCLDPGGTIIHVAIGDQPVRNAPPATPRSAGAESRSNLPVPSTGILVSTCS